MDTELVDYEGLFDVVVYEIATRKIESMIGKNMRQWDGTGSGRYTAEMRRQTGQQNVNDQFDVAIVPAGQFKKGDALPKDVE